MPHTTCSIPDYAVSKLTDVVGVTWANYFIIKARMQININMTFVFFSFRTRTLLTHQEERGAGEENRRKQGNESKEVLHKKKITNFPYNSLTDFRIFAFFIFFPLSLSLAWGNSLEQRCSNNSSDQPRPRSRATAIDKSLRSAHETPGTASASLCRWTCTL